MTGGRSVRISSATKSNPERESVAGSSDPDLLERVAYHEAGHAVVAYVLGIDDIEIEGGPGGVCTTSRAKLAPTVQRAVLIDFAGREAESHRFGSASESGSVSDDQRAAETINAAGVTKAVGYAIIDRQLNIIATLIRHTGISEAVDSLAVHLLRKPLPWKLPHAERLISSLIARDEALAKTISDCLNQR